MKGIMGIVQSALAVVAAVSMILDEGGDEKEERDKALVEIKGLIATLKEQKLLPDVWIVDMIFNKKLIGALIGFIHPLRGKRSYIAQLVHDGITLVLAVVAAVERPGEGADKKEEAIAAVDSLRREGEEDGWLPKSNLLGWLLSKGVVSVLIDFSVMVANRRGDFFRTSSSSSEEVN